MPSLIEVQPPNQAATEPRLFRTNDNNGLEEYFNERIRIPLEAIKYGIEGYETVFALINKSGQLTGARGISTRNGIFLSEAIRLVNHARWDPATINGEAIDVYVLIKVPFYY